MDFHHFLSISRNSGAFQLVMGQPPRPWPDRFVRGDAQHRRSYLSPTWSTTPGWSLPGYVGFPARHGATSNTLDAGLMETRDYGGTPVWRAGNLHVYILWFMAVYGCLWYGKNICIYIYNYIYVESIVDGPWWATSILYTRNMQHDEFTRFYQLSYRWFGCPSFQEFGQAPWNSWWQSSMDVPIWWLQQKHITHRDLWMSWSWESGGSSPQFYNSYPQTLGCWKISTSNMTELCLWCEHSILSPRETSETWWTVLYGT